MAELLITAQLDLWQRTYAKLLPPRRKRARVPVKWPITEVRLDCPQSPQGSAIVLRMNLAERSAKLHSFSWPVFKLSDIGSDIGHSTLDSFRGLFKVDRESLQNMRELPKATSIPTCVPIA